MQFERVFDVAPIMLTQHKLQLAKNSVNWLSVSQIQPSKIGLNFNSLCLCSKIPNLVNKTKGQKSLIKYLRRIVNASSIYISFILGLAVYSTASLTCTHYMKVLGISRQKSAKGFCSALLTIINHII